MVETMNYIKNLQPGKITLWCYLIWYVTAVFLNFDPDPSIWINSLGISFIIGSGLLLSVNHHGRTDHWQTFRLYFMPFGVSSFATLIKNKGFFLIFPSNFSHLAILIGACILFLALVFSIKWIARGA